MPVAYDAIGRTYALHRQPDPRLASSIVAALGEAVTVVNVGAGTGSYEPRRSGVVAVEPSSIMIAQREPSGAPAVSAKAEALPFRDETFDAALAVLTIHHWNDQRRGLEECARVARKRVVMLTWDPESDGFWLTQEYFPEMLALDRRRFPPLQLVAAVLGRINVRPIPIPADCADGFLGAFWKRPDAYLDPSVRKGISSFSFISNTEAQLTRLREDIVSGAWKRRHQSLLNRGELDIGYRLIVADKLAPS